MMFGIAIALVCSYEGYITEAGAEGVGRSTARAVVIASVTILVLDALTAGVLQPLPANMKRRDEVSVGIVITVAVVVLLLGTLWLVRGGLKNGYPLHTRFAWGQNLKQGQPVLLAGVSVGYVGDVTLRRDGYLESCFAVYDQYQIPEGIGGDGQGDRHLR